MSNWNLELFTAAVRDYERAQYGILAGLQEARRQFSSTRIYPDLGYLINIYGTLQTIVQNTVSLKNALPGRIKEIDFEKQQAVYEKVELKHEEMVIVEELIQWSLPYIKEAIDEAKTIFEFVEENLHLEEVGIVPLDVSEGYLLVPDYEVRRLRILQYNFSIYAGVQERYRTLRTSHVRSIRFRKGSSSPNLIKQKLIKRRRDFPNPATYFISSDIDFPYEATMLPIAKRKLMRYLFNEGSKT